MSSSSFLAAARSSGGTRFRFALGRFGGTRGGAVAAPGCVVPTRGRSASSTSAASAGGMEHPKEPPQQEAVGGDKNTRDGAHKPHWDPMTHSFGEGYSTRADEEGFGTVYARGDDEDRPGHPEYDTSQGHEVKEKEKGRHVKDDKQVT